MLSQGALFWNALNSIAAHDMTSADHVLTVLPMFHVGGLNIQTTPAILAGATITLARRFDPDETLDLLAARRPTLFLAVPAVAQALSRHPRFAAADLSSLRAMCTGSSTVPEAVIRPWMDRGIPVTQVYGMTESGPTAIALSIADAARKVGSCGKPAAHCEARIVDAEGRDVPARSTGRDLAPRPESDDRLLAQSRGDRQKPSPTAGCTPATSATRTPTASTTSTTARRTS